MIIILIMMEVCLHKYNKMRLYKNNILDSLWDELWSQRSILHSTTTFMTCQTSTTFLDFSVNNPLIIMFIYFQNAKESGQIYYIEFGLIF